MRQEKRKKIKYNIYMKQEKETKKEAEKGNEIKICADFFWFCYGVGKRMRKEEGRK